MSKSHGATPKARTTRAFSFGGSFNRQDTEQPPGYAAFSAAPPHKICHNGKCVSRPL